MNLLFVPSSDLQAPHPPCKWIYIPRSDRIVHGRYSDLRRREESAASHSERMAYWSEVASKTRLIAARGLLTSSVLYGLSGMASGAILASFY